jgi:hypothetical protein
MIAISAYGLKNGNPTRLTYPYDPDGNACGLTAGYENSKYIYFPVPQLNFISRSVINHLKIDLRGRLPNFRNYRSMFYWNCISRCKV